MIGQLSWPRGSIHQNCSAPLMPHFPSSQTTDFDWLAQDPMPVQTDLAHLAVCVDPRRNLYLWRSLLARYNVPPSSIPIRHLYAVWPFYPHPMNIAISGRDYQTTAGTERRGAFIEFLREEDASWAKWMAKIKKPLRGERLSEEEHARLSRDLLDVAGFWLFEPDTFGAVPDVGSVDMDDRRARLQPKMVVGLTQHTPKLGIFKLNA